MTFKSPASTTKSLKVTIQHVDSSKPDETHTVDVPVKRGTILHVQAGIPDVWEPTDEEMDFICKLFLTAMEDDSGGVVVTREGITVDVIDLNPKDEKKS